MPPFNNPDDLRHRAQQQQPPPPSRRHVHEQDAGAARLYPTIPAEREPTAQERNEMRKRAVRDAVKRRKAAAPAAPAAPTSDATPPQQQPVQAGPSVNGPCGGKVPCPAASLGALAAMWMFPCAIPIVVGVWLTAQADQTPLGQGTGGGGGGGGGGTWKKKGCSKKVKAAVVSLFPVFVLAWFIGKPLCCAGFVVAAVAGALILYSQDYGQERPSSSTFFKVGVFVLYVFGLRTVLIAAFATKMLGPLILGWPDSKCKQRVCEKMKACRDKCEARAATCKCRVLNAVKEFFSDHEADANAADAATATAAASTPTAPAAPQQPAARQQQQASETKPALQWETKTWPDGSHYTGSMLDGKRHGHGSYSWADGSSYTGEWQGDRLHGNGVFKFANGDVFTGEYADDKKQGHGKYQWAGSDQVFEGHWESDAMADSAGK